MYVVIISEKILVQFCVHDSCALSINIIVIISTEFQPVLYVLAEYLRKFVYLNYQHMDIFVYFLACTTISSHNDFDLVVLVGKGNVKKLNLCVGICRSLLQVLFSLSQQTLRQSRNMLEFLCRMICQSLQV